MKKGLVILVLVVGIVGAYRFYTGALGPADPLDDSRVIVDIESGATGAKVAEQLKEKGLIESVLAFKLYLGREGLENQIKSGRFVLSPNQSLKDIVDALVSGKTGELSVTLLEGWTAEQMGEKLEELGVTTKAAFTGCVKSCLFPEFDFLPPKKSLEGYLYPDTYFVDPGNFSAQSFIKRLIQTFRNRLDNDWAAIQKNRRTLKELVIMASIVEREERDLEERPRVAGILWKRTDANRGLDADATILYALGRTSGGLTYQDLQTDSLYNTRKYRGLPPGPISNPSISSLRAALYPESTPYWYYLHDGDGQVHYGKTLEEHNENKARYIN